ncbi:MAG TPA: hypothetical protein VEO18_02865 [Thermoplasmata archaeon]|nr:hypothetical protein [Thermoplasmata archaeon]
MTSDETEADAKARPLLIPFSVNIVQVLTLPTGGTPLFPRSGTTGGIPRTDFQAATFIRAELVSNMAPMLDLFKEVADLRKKVDELTRDHETPVLRDLPKEEVMAIVRSTVERLETGEAISPSDIAFEYGILPQLVEECLEELAKEGKLDTRHQRRGRRQN